MPESVYSLMSLFPRRAQRRPSVEFVPVPYREPARAAGQRAGSRRAGPGHSGRGAGARFERAIGRLHDRVVDVRMASAQRGRVAQQAAQVAAVPCRLLRERPPAWAQQYSMVSARSSGSASSSTRATSQ